MKKEALFINLGNMEIGREKLGKDMPVSMYRLFEYSIKDILGKRYGKKEAIEIFRETGQHAGLLFANDLLDFRVDFSTFISQLQEALKKYKIGILRIEKFEEKTGDVTLTVEEDLDCSGLPVTGETVCHYDEGFIAGILTAYTKKAYCVREIDCWALGARVCRFEAKLLLSSDIEMNQKISHI